MKLVMSYNYYNYCDSWDTDLYVEYESKEKLMRDFSSWYFDAKSKEFLGFEIDKLTAFGNDQYSEMEFYTLEEWWDRKVGFKQVVDTGKKLS